jgi:hypothetical protein
MNASRQCGQFFTLSGRCAAFLHFGVQYFRPLPPPKVTLH